MTSVRFSKGMDSYMGRCEASPVAPGGRGCRPVLPMGEKGTHHILIAEEAHCGPVRWDFARERASVHVHHVPVRGVAFHEGLGERADRHDLQSTFTDVVQGLTHEDGGHPLAKI